MRFVMIFSILFSIVNLSCASTMEPTKKGEQPVLSEQPLAITSPLLKTGYTFFGAKEAKKSLTNQGYLIARSQGTELNIQDTAGFAQVVHGVASKAEALELVRLLTSQELRPFLKDVYYTEVHKQTDPQDRWFAIETKQYDAWSLHDPIITEAKNGIYIIERFVACYPRVIHGKFLTEAKLVKIREWVSSEGQYAAEILNTLDEGDAIHKLLIFTK